MELKDYTPEQTMAKNIVASECTKYHTCDECPMHTLDNGLRPSCCADYVLQHPTEVLKAFGVELPKRETVDRAECLEKAKAAVTGQRETDYGTPEDSFRRIANLWGAYQGCEYTTQDVAVMMALLKIARIGGGRSTVDSWVDLAGYAACGCEIATAE